MSGPSVIVVSPQPGSAGAGPAVPGVDAGPAARGPADWPGRLDALSDRLSPLVVKEVRQFVRGRDFLASFGSGLVVGLLISFVASIEAMGGSTTAGASAFATLTICLSLLGLAVVPLGAFSALRTERLEQTLDLISLTTMSARRIVIGKLMAQILKLITFFAAMAPFMATSFLLGGVDLVTILSTLATLFLCSVWVAAAAMLISTAFKSRMLSTLMLGAFALAVFVVYMGGRSVVMVMLSGYPIFGARGPFPGAGGSMWWVFSSIVLFGLTTLMNIVLLAESRLALPTEDRVPMLRIGFLVQFLVLILWVLALSTATGLTANDVADGLLVLGSVHLVLVALFGVTEGLAGAPSAAALPGLLKRWPSLQGVLGAGTSRAVVYVALHMVLFVAAGSYLWDWAASETRHLIAICGAILLFTGVPTLIVHYARRPLMGPLHARGIALLLLAASMLLPDTLYYMLWSADQPFSLSFEWRHLFSPARIPFNWSWIEQRGLEIVPLLWAVLGVLSYVALLRAKPSGAARAQPITNLGLAAGAARDGDSD
jgi:hypothetical protein